MALVRTFEAVQAASAIFTGQLLVNVNGPDPILDDSWNAYVRWTSTVVETGLDFVTVLTFSPRQSPNARQRALLTEQIVRSKEQFVNQCVAVLTDSALVRGTITAFSWVARDLRTKAFRPHDLEAAFAWLKLRSSFDEVEVKAWLATTLVNVGYSAAQTKLWLA